MAKDATNDTIDTPTTIDPIIKPVTGKPGSNQNTGEFVA